MLTPDTILQGRYRIIRQLGQGGMGAVYEAVDQRLDTTVALKETLFTDERLRRQFEREARLLARLHHPALPRVSDHFSEGDGQFLIMQYIPGDDLSEMMARRQGPFPASQVLSWADQLLDALDYLHTQEPQIIHRDIKPQNLKLTARGQIILLDFGLAKGQGGDISRVTTAASIFGYTPNYAPLEQIQGLGTDLRSDLYSLAATMYHLLTGVKPPDALSRAAALVNGQDDPLLLASEANPAAGVQADQVLKKAMSQNREACAVVGVDVQRVARVTFALSAMLAALAAALVSPLFNIFPDMGAFLTLKAFAAVIVGGFGYVKGAIAASFLIGIAEVYLALIESERGKTEAALRTLDEAKHNYDVSYGKIHPNHGDLLVYRAKFLAKAGRMAEARADCAAGLKILRDTLGADAGFTQANEAKCAAIAPPAGLQTAALTAVKPAR